jgi:hypothetical protein
MPNEDVNTSLCGVQANMQDVLAGVLGEGFFISMGDREHLVTELRYLYAVREAAKVVLQAADEDDDKAGPGALQALRWLLETARVTQ